MQGISPFEEFPPKSLTSPEPRTDGDVSVPFFWMISRDELCPRQIRTPINAESAPSLARNLRPYHLGSVRLLLSTAIDDIKHFASFLLEASHSQVLAGDQENRGLRNLKP